MNDILMQIIENAERAASPVGVLNMQGSLSEILWSIPFGIGLSALMLDNYLRSHRTR